MCVADNAATHLLKSKAQWDKTKPKSRCQCHACGEREGQGQNCSYVHGNHPSSAMFGACDDLVGLSIVKNKQTIAIAAKYPMRSAAIVTSSITLPQFGTMLQKQAKSCALRHTRDCGRNGIIPGPQVAKAGSRTQHSWGTCGYRVELPQPTCYVLAAQVMITDYYC